LQPKFPALTLAIAGRTSNGDVRSSEQNATERIVVGGRRSDVSDDVHHVTTERDRLATTMTFEFDSPSIEVQLSSLWPLHLTIWLLSYWHMARTGVT